VVGVGFVLTNNEEWMKNDWLGVDFGDKRLNKRAKEIALDFLRNPFDSPPKMLKDPDKIKAFYRLMDSDKVTHDKIISNHVRNTKYSMENKKIILAIQDASTISLNRNYEVEGLYLVGNATGLVVQNTISVIPNEHYGVIDGLLNQIILDRKPKKKRNDKDNEMRLWKDSIKAVGFPPKNTIIVDVFDRGGDALDVMHCSKENKHDFVIRAQQSRNINEKQNYLFDFARSLKAKGHYTLELQGTTGRKTKRIFFKSNT
jgi:hypothetical protein